MPSPEEREVERLLAKASRQTSELLAIKERADRIADERAEVFDQLRAAGVSVRHIASRAGVSHSAVNATLRVRRERVG